MANPDDLNKEIEDYWKSTNRLIETYLDDAGHENIHYGYHEGGSDIENTASATNEMNHRLAEAADIGPDDRVLFCGCGVGGPAIWVAENRGAEVVGINIVEPQLERARENAVEAGVDDRAEFRYDDLTKMETVEDGAIDVVWAIEAVIYAEDKRDFVDQARRVLGDDGRLVVADGFRTERSLSEADEELLRKLADNWAVPNFALLDEFTAHLEDAGFRDVDVEVIQDHIEGFSRWQYIGRYQIYVFKLLQKLGVITEAEAKHQFNRHYQYQVFDRDLLKYCTVSAELED